MERLGQAASAQGTRHMTTTSHTQWGEARRHLREWMLGSAVSQSELARLAGLHRSVIHKFLEKDQPIGEKTATKLYEVLKLNLDTTERQRWIAWLNLDKVSAVL